jgi:hypothetical protein
VAFSTSTISADIFLGIAPTMDFIKSRIIGFERVVGITIENCEMGGSNSVLPVVKRKLNKL